jgi:methyl-accepting chemotaxis protein
MQTAGLCDLYRITEENLAQRRAFIDLKPRDIRRLAKLEGWAKRQAPAIAKEFYDHQFAEPGSRSFFERHAKAREMALSDLRRGLESAQAGYFAGIFEEAAGAGTFGRAYFEQRLHVGALHNKIDLPLKWYLGSYVTYFDLAIAHLRRSFPQRPALRTGAIRALTAVFNLDMQAIVEAFYYDTFKSMGVNLALVEVTDPVHDLSDQSAQLKSRVNSALDATCRTTSKLRAASTQIAQNADETGRAVAEIAEAVEHVAVGSERQTSMLESASAAVDAVCVAVSQSTEGAQETAQMAQDARATAHDGVRTAEEASRSMTSVRDSAEQAADAIRALAAKSEQISAIVVTISGIAEQTNLLALNAAIEAARAGEQGKGFAVVADEVRKLAESSQEASGEISGLIAEIQSETRRAVEIVETSAQDTHEGVASVDRARDAFESIGGAVDEIADRVGRIAEAVHEIADSTSVVKGSVSEIAALAEAAAASTQQVSASTQQTSASSQETAASAQELAQIAQDLSDITCQFEIS